MSKKHVLIVTPAYSGTVHVQYACSLADTLSLLRAHNIDVTIRIGTGGSLLVAERNRLTEYFWQSEATHMLCIDSDLGWPPEAVLAMLDTNKEFVAGVYPSRKKHGFVFRPTAKEGEPLTLDNHLIEAEYVPAGFMLISREAIKKMRDKFPELYYAPKDARSETESTYCLFNTEVWNGEFWGEDYVFCRRAREAGVQIWVDPLITFDHAGVVGCLTSILTEKKPEEMVGA